MKKMSKSLLVILDWRYCSKKKPVFRIHRIHMFLGLPDPDPLVRGNDPDPGPDPCHQAKIVRKTLIHTVL